LRIFPPGPFPPWGFEGEGTIDLGIRVRDRLFRRDLIAGLARRRLSGLIGSAGDEAAGLVRVMHLVEPFFHTWALGSMIDAAREKWTEGPDARSLAVLGRASEIAAFAVGWPTTIDRRWPLPDVDWMRMQVPEGVPCEVVPRGPRDGAYGVAIALGHPLARPEPIAVPPYLELPADLLADRCPELLERMARHELVAVRWSGPTPESGAALEAAEALRRASPVQLSFERYGLAALLTGPVPDFEDLLVRPPPGQPGPVLRRICDVALLPRLLPDGRVEIVGVLLWDGPHPPAFVVVGAAELLRLLDGNTPVDVIAARVGAPVEVIGRVLDQLLAAGAASA
jgi:hypothetical protein